ncbi:MAG TPA: hypothetical protein VHM88_24430 [Candidatus Acidoferrales bacterium]|nr:hypothetical protein [Candidatus Acidoferrales bacterium]
MKAQRLAILLTVINFMLLLLNMMQTGSTTAQTVAPILRVHALEVVDERNVVRARLGVKGSNGAIELNLNDQNGINHVKLGAANAGTDLASGLVVADGGTDPASGSHVQTYVQVIARWGVATAERPTTRIKLSGADGRERVITP